MARNYSRMKEIWKDTTKANQFKQDILDSGYWWNIDSFLTESNYARDIMEDTFNGMNLKNCTTRTIEKLWNKVGNEKMVRTWIEYNDKWNDIEEEYNMWWWTENDRDVYKKDEQEA